MSALVLVESLSRSEVKARVESSMACSNGSAHPHSLGRRVHKYVADYPVPSDRVDRLVK